MKSNNPIFTVDGTGSNGRNTLRIVHIERHKIAAEVLCGGSNITADTNPDHYTWYKRVGEDAEWVAAASGTKELSLVQSEMDAGFQYKCSYAGAVEEYGVLQVDNTTMASHTPGTADANDTFSLNGGVLSVTTDRTAGANYSLEDGNVKIESSNCETISATASFGARTTGKVISFKYNHNGLRTQKKVVENGVTTTYDYTLHGKLITHLTKKTVDETEEETNKEELHFFYDSQSRPAFVEYNGEMYRYIHNLQGDIVGIVDAEGNLVVEYKYDAWGKQIYEAGSMLGSLGNLSPFRYRGYVWDVDLSLYYLKSRFFNPHCCRFLNADSVIYADEGQLFTGSFCYCANNPTKNVDYSGRKHAVHADVAGEYTPDTFIGKVKTSIVQAVVTYSSIWYAHVNRNKEQEEYLNELQSKLGSEKELIDYLKDNWAQQPVYKNVFHINVFSSQGLEALYNVKYMSEDGRYEVVICSPPDNDAYIVTSNVNKGTSNYGTDAISHFTYDMFTYFFWGNTGFDLEGDFIRDMVGIF